MRHASLLLAAIAFSPAAAFAHVSITSGPGFADKSQEVTFSIGHGCEGTDTSKLRIELPAAVTAVRAETSDFGRATVERNAAGEAIAVSWQKPDADLLDGDDNYYKLVIRFKVPNQPFTTLRFPAHQTCRTPGGTEKVVDWIAIDESGGEPAPVLRILPARAAGWNKLTVPAALSADDLAIFFADAAIVWRGKAAFSANPVTVAQIAATPDVTPLTALAAGDEIWVRY